MRLALWRAYSQADTRWHTVPLLPLTSIVAHARHCGLDIVANYCVTADALVGSEADAYCISSVTGCWPETLAVVERLRVRGKPIIIGGPHITCLPECLPDGCIGVLGEGEQTFADLLYALQGGINIAAVGHLWHGAVCKVDGTTLGGKPRPRMSLDGCRHLPVYMEIGPGTLQAVATRGCPFNCWFCCARKLWKVGGSPAVTRFPPDYVAEQIGGYFRDRQPGHVTFQDLNFASDKRWVYALIEELRKQGAPDKFRIEGVSYSAAYQNADLIRALQSVGVEWLGIGVESASPRLFPKLKPHLKLEQNGQLIELAHGLGMQVRGSFIIGTPGETAEDLEASLAFIEKYKSKGFVQAGLFMFTPYPGTPAWSQLLAEGRVSTDMDFSLLTNGANPDLREVGYWNPAMPYPEAVTWRRKLSIASR